MKSIINYFGIALATFVLGIVAVDYYNRIFLEQLTNKEKANISDKKELLEGDKRTNIPPDIRVEFINRREDEFGYIFYFQVTNYGSQQASYISRGKDTVFVCDSLINTGTEIKSSGGCECGNSMSIGSLLPNQSRIVPISIYDKTEIIQQVGFTFWFGKTEVKHTFWSNYFNISEN